MELLQLQYFQVIARTQNISAAAKELHVAQPSLSQLLKRLEQEVGVPLFDRTGKHIKLNQYGAVFLKYTDEIFTSLRNASAEIQTLLGNETKNVNLYMGAASMLLPDLYARIREKDPSILLNVLQNNSDHQLCQNELMISSVRELPENMENSCFLMEEEIQLALPQGHPLLEKSVVFRDDLCGLPFISLASDSSLSRILSFYFKLYQFEPKITTFIDNPDIMRKLLIAHAGLAFIPKSTWKGFSLGDVVLRSVEDMPMKRFLILSWDPSAYLTPSMLCCRNVISEFFTRYSSQVQE